MYEVKKIIFLPYIFSFNFFYSIRMLNIGVKNYENVHTIRIGHRRLF